MPQSGLGGVSTANGEFVDDTQLHAGLGGVYSYNEYDECEVTSVYVGYFFQVWGHIITDCLKFLWFLHTDEYKRLLLHGNVRLVYICDPNFDLRKISELLSLADINSSRFERIERVTKFRNLIVPDPCFFLHGFYRYYTQEYRELIDRIISKVTADKQEKVYLTRTRLHDCRDYGEKKIEKAFKEKGYKIVSPERLTLKEQISIYKGANILATTEGSISHNAVFMRQGAQLVVLRKCDCFNTYQEAINDVHSLNVTYIDAHLSCFVDAKAPWFGPFFLYCNDNLSKFLGCKKRFSTLLFMFYTFKCFRKNNVERRMRNDEGLYRKMGTELSEFISIRQKAKMFINKFKRSLFLH